MKGLTWCIAQKTMMLGMKVDMVRGHWHWGVEYLCLLLFGDMKWWNILFCTPQCKLCLENQIYPYFGLVIWLYLLASQ
jgi:hypothetical protein